MPATPISDSEAWSAAAGVPREGAACGKRVGAAAPREPRFSLARQARFLAVLEETSNITLAAREAGVDPRSARRLRSSNPAFEARWREAIDAGVVDLEARMLERARFGSDEVQTTTKDGDAQRRVTRKLDPAQGRWFLTYYSKLRADLSVERERAAARAGAEAAAGYDEARLRTRLIAALATLRAARDVAPGAMPDAPRIAAHRLTLEGEHLPDAIASLDDAEAGALERALDPADNAERGSAWSVIARPEQRAPTDPWTCWLLMAGRGFGKTRTGAEWVFDMALAAPDTQIALVGATLDDVRRVMIEGESGVIACTRRRAAPAWHPARRQLVWPNGSVATAYSAADPEGLRGPAHHYAWIDELARWEAHGTREGGALDPRSAGKAALDNLLMGLRLGATPRLVATTTPRPVPILRQLIAREGTRVTRGATADNAANLPEAFLTDMRATYGDTLLGRQELLGELIEDAPDALWPRATIEATRVEALSPAETARFQRIVVGVDPPASDRGDACGIVVCGVLREPGEAGEGAQTPRYLVLADASVERASPERWAAAVAEAAARWGVDCVVAEANNGGAMVRSVLAAADSALPIRLVHARRGKHARAEPIALKWAAGEAGCAGVHPRLEDEMSGLCGHGGYLGPTRSPDRADAMVWAMTALTEGARVAPRVRGL